MGHGCVHPARTDRRDPDVVIEPFIAHGLTQGHQRELATGYPAIRPFTRLPLIETSTWIRPWPED